MATKAPATAALAATILVALALAGCSGPEDPTAARDADERPRLSAGKGAISGLLVDDRYRPLHLTDTPRGPYDVPGFILVVETGDQVATDAEGVFRIFDLAPGPYTLRPAVERHEGTAQRVNVVAGEYAEVDLLVRRIVDPGKDVVIVHDDTMLITCSVQVLDGHFTVGRTCHADLSGQGGTNWIDYNFTEFRSIAAVVVEARTTRAMDFEVWLTRQTNIIDGPALYGKVYGYDSDSIRIAALNGTEVGRFGGALLDAMDLRVWANINGPGTQEFDELTGLPIGADFTFVAEVRVVLSAFLEEPADLDSYSVLG